MLDMQYPWDICFPTAMVCFSFEVLTLTTPVAATDYPFFPHHDRPIRKQFSLLNIGSCLTLATLWEATVYQKYYAKHVKLV